LHDGLEAKLADPKQGGPCIHAVVEELGSLFLVESAPAEGVAHEAQIGQRHRGASGLRREEGRRIGERHTIQRPVVPTVDREQRILACTILEFFTVVYSRPGP